jgi:hypothetical protein
MNDQPKIDKVPETLRIRVGAEQTKAEGWRFVLTTDREPSFRVTREFESLPGSGGVPLATPAADPDCTLEACLRHSPEQFLKALKELRGRTGGGGACVGHYLFTVLLGSDWSEVSALAARLEATTVELALTWPGHDPWTRLSDLPWELMHDGRRFLATSGGEVGLAVTRVVAGTTSAMPELPVPAKVLFVVSAALTDAEIRPGAEMLALIREVRGAGRRIQHRVLHHATPDRLARAVGVWRPDVVHFIGHGGVSLGDGRGYLRLLSDDRDQQHADLRADQLVERLASAGVLPPIVVLSACATGGGVGGPIGGPEMTAPMAMDLVAAGIPVVVAMAGFVTDRACRVFNRVFAGALAAGDSLVVATAQARRIAFAQETEGSAVDWAMPAVFFAEEVDPDDVHYAPDPVREQLDGWIKSLVVARTPVFCAREEFFDSFWSMLAGRSSGWERGDVSRPPSGMLICVDNRFAGVGKTRLLEELARSALEDGHLPLLIGTDKGYGVPADLHQLSRHLGRAMGLLGKEVLRLGGGFGGQLTSLAAVFVAAGGEDFESVREHSRLCEDVQESLQLGAVYGLREALRVDAAQLIEAAHQANPDVFGEATRVVVLIDDLDLSSVPLIEALVERRLLDENGLGTVDQPVPVAVVVRYGDEGDIRRRLYERGTDVASMDVLALKPFDDATGEDLLAYERVLLNPFRTDDVGDLAKEWVFNRALDPAKWDKGIGTIRHSLQGRPVRFHEEAYELTVRYGSIGELLISATDEERVRAEVREVRT